MNIARTYGWIKQDATEFYDSEAKNVTNITGGITNTFVNTHTQETLDTQYGTFTLDLWYDKDENKWYDTTELIGGGDFTLTNASFDTISPIKSQDGETASLYERIDWTNIEHFDEFKYFTNITSIDNYFFKRYTNLTSITIPDSVTSIGDETFYHCTSLTSVTIGSGVTSIGKYAFYECTSLTSINIPSGVTSIGNLAFDSCSGLTSVTIPDSVTGIDDSAFGRCTSLPIIDNIRYADTFAVEAVDVTLTEYTFKSGTKWIGDFAFNGCSRLTSITIPNGVMNIGEAAFQQCNSLSSITIPNSVTSIGGNAFSNCSGATSLSIGSGVTSIGSYAFASCTDLTSIVIPDSVTSIGNGAFKNCSGLTSITIGSGVTSIGDKAFQNCSGLASVTSLAITAPTIENNTFRDVKANGTLTVPSGSSGYDVWMDTGNYYLGKYGWTKVEQ
jgi:hypothetical protein